MNLYEGNSYLKFNCHFFVNNMCCSTLWSTYPPRFSSIELKLKEEFSETKQGMEEQKDRKLEIHYEFCERDYTDFDKKAVVGSNPD